MGANSTQGLGVLVFLAAFTCLGAALLADGSVMFLLLFLVGIVASVGLFLKAKPMEQMEK